MIKAVFLDHAETIAEEDQSDLEQMIQQDASSRLKDTEPAAEWRFENLRVLKQNSCEASFLSENKIMELSRKMAEEEDHMNDAQEAPVKLNPGCWKFALAFSYAKILLQCCGKQAGGLVCSNMIRVSAQYKKLSRTALHTVGIPVIEILTNGCSPASDIKGTSAVGRNAVLIEQKNRTDTDRCRMIHDLKEALTLI
ncbi:MAG: hypothetical protein EOM64_05645 [Erysipelotrichia bacterium]|nr:hypothetical protein [Erysipelotrichia bacterium]